MRERFKKLGVNFREFRTDYVGVNMLHGEAAPVEDKDLNEVGLRIAARTNTYQEAEMVRREATHSSQEMPSGSRASSWR